MPNMCGNKQFKGGLGHKDRWQAPGDPSREVNLKLLTQKAKGVEGCNLSFSFPFPLIQPCQLDSVRTLVPGRSAGVGSPGIQV